MKTINFEAMHLTQLINVSQNGVCEPPFIECFSENEHGESLMNGTKLDLPDLPFHVLGNDRAVKLTKEAFKSVYSFEGKHRQLIAKVLCHK